MPEVTDYIIDQLVEEAKTLPEQKNRCRQHLIELGYIPMFKVNALLAKDLTIAKEEFLKDAMNSGLYNENELIHQVFEEEDEFYQDCMQSAKLVLKMV